MTARRFRHRRNRFPRAQLANKTPRRTTCTRAVQVFDTGNYKVFADFDGPVEVLDDGPTGIRAVTPSGSVLFTIVSESLGYQIELMKGPVALPAGSFLQIDPNTECLSFPNGPISVPTYTPIET